MPATDELASDGLAALFERSAGLWESPWDAPEVPPRARLRAWLDGEALEPHLVQQITESPNALAALDELRLATPLPQTVTARLLDRLREIEKAAAPAAPPTASSPKVLMPACQPGSLCRTRGQVEIGSAELTLRQTFDPVPVLLISGPHERGYDCVWRAVAISPAGSWPQDLRTPQDVEIADTAGHAWVAHLDMEYPVSQDQLHAAFAEVASPVLARLQELGAGWPEGAAPESEALATQVQLARERLLARCAFLPMTADARRLRAEWWQEQVDLLQQAEVEAVAPANRRSGVTQMTRALPARLHEELSHLALAARDASGWSDPHTSQAIVLPNAVDLMRRRLREELLLKGSNTIQADLPPSEDTALAGSAFAQWNVASLGVDRSRTLPFVVVSPDRHAILATGLVRGGVATALSCDWSAAEPLLDQLRDWLLVIFEG